MLVLIILPILGSGLYKLIDKNRIFAEMKILQCIQNDVVDNLNDVIRIARFALNILKAKSNFTLLLYIPFLGIGEWYCKYV